MTNNEISHIFVMFCFPCAVDTMRGTGWVRAFCQAVIRQNPTKNGPEMAEKWVFEKQLKSAEKS